MEASDFLSKILWDLSNLDEKNISPKLNAQLIDIRGEIGSYLGLDYQNDNEDYQEDYEDYDHNDDQGHCGCSLGMDPNTECPTCS